MKLRFRANSLRLRVNQKEVERLASGEALTEQISFPGNSALSYTLKTAPSPVPGAVFMDDRIEVNAPSDLVAGWARAEEIGLYFTLPTGAEPLRIAIEKDLVCIDGPAEERDPQAFPRPVAQTTC